MKGAGEKVLTKRSGKNRKPSDKKAPPPVVNKTARRLFIIFGFIAVISTMAYIYLSGRAGFEWYVLAKDGCAPITRASADLHTPSDVADHFLCSVTRTDKLYDSFTDNFYELNCNRTLKIDLMLVSGKETCEKTWRIAHGKEKLVKEPSLSDQLVQVFRGMMESNVALPDVTSITPDPSQRWYMLGTDGCTFVADYDTKMTGITDFYKKFSCQVSNAQRLYGSAELNYYTLKCPDYPGGSAVFVHGQMICERLATEGMNSANGGSNPVAPEQNN